MFGLLFVLAFLLSGFVTYHLLKLELSTALDASVEEIYSVVRSSYAPNDIEDLTTTINTYASLNKASDRVFSLTDASNRHIAGNFTAPPLVDGLSTVRATDIGILGEGSFRIRSGMVGTDRLVVGQSFAETDRLETIAFMSFGWATVLIVTLAIGGGLWLASRAQRRLDGIARTMVEVSHGDLTSRIPLQGNGDDIDVVSGQINRAIDRLSGLVEGMRQVSSDIAHDLKTPLNRLKMIIEDALSRDERGLPVANSLIEARLESDQINATFEALLRISQIEAGARKERFRPVDLVRIMSSVAEIYAGVAEDNDQSLEFVTRLGQSPRVVGDSELLTQLLVNLVENAINHCPAGTRIVMSLSDQEHSLCASVADDGPGIPETERTLVFRRLYRLDKSRTTPGNGLGLSLVKAIADLHSASIKMTDNEPGLRVAIEFPKQPLPTGS
jgi:signal transduction histidine kinase